MKDDVGRIEQPNTDVSTKRFRIALSFTGEHREFVRQVANILAERFGEGKILYDEFHRAEFARGDLAITLPRLYRDDADLIVPILCPGYPEKDWTGLEWRAVLGVLKERRDQDVMLCRFALVEAEELHGLAGYLDLDRCTAADCAQRILERLAVNEGRNKDFYLDGQPDDGSDWPAAAPELAWPVADHTEARVSFAQLITRDSPYRFLPIKGVSGTGKSHLTKHFLGNALRIPALSCGRFDFKGSADMDAELRSFAEILEVQPPTAGSGVTAQLSEIFAALRAKARPTLLIFDTFELAGDAQQWVRESLLLSVIRSPWLRVVVVGQDIPAGTNEPWSGFSAEQLVLQPPSPEEWFEYAREHKPDLTLEFVRQAHTYADGQCVVLDQLLGPGA